MIKEILLEYGELGILAVILMTGIGVLWKAYQKQVKINAQQLEKMIEVTTSLTSLISGLSEVTKDIPEKTAEKIEPELTAIRMIVNDIKGMIK